MKTLHRINIDNVITDDNPLLREKSLDVKLPLSNEDSMTIKSMLEYVIDSQDDELSTKYNLKPAVGIAAPQLGILKNLIAVSVETENDDGTFQRTSYALANPKIISHSVTSIYLANGEGCLSVPENRQGYVKRHERIKIKAYDTLKNTEVIIKEKGFTAIVLQHEIDHLNGILYYDRFVDIEDIENDPLITSI